MGTPNQRKCSPKPVLSLSLLRLQLLPKQNGLATSWLSTSCLTTHWTSSTATRLARAVMPPRRSRLSHRRKSNLVRSGGSTWTLAALTGASRASAGGPFQAPLRTVNVNHTSFQVQSPHAHGSDGTENSFQSPVLKPLLGTLKPRETSASATCLSPRSLAMLPRSTASAILKSRTARRRVLTSTKRSYCSFRTARQHVLTSTQRS